MKVESLSLNKVSIHIILCSSCGHSRSYHGRSPRRILLLDKCCYSHNMRCCHTCSRHQCKTVSYIYIYIYVIQHSCFNQLLLCP
uniref:Uncharacterized protein n=1 Tax=Cucumis melo TaxID=3656 RepID=A0A9I9ELV8_CUCME